MDTLCEKFPNAAIMADANCAYRLEDTAWLKRLDQCNVTTVERPLVLDDRIDHATLQKQMTTPICLDEGIYSMRVRQFHFQH